MPRRIGLATDSGLLDDWLRVALLEWITHKSPEAKIERLAAAFYETVSPERIHSALKFLEEAGFVKRARTSPTGTSRPLNSADEDPEGNEHLMACTGELSTTHNIPNCSIRMFHEQMLHLANRSLHRDPTEDRTFLGHTMAISSTKLAEANALLLEFRQKFTCTMNSSTPGDPLVSEWKYGLSNTNDNE